MNPQIGSGVQYRARGGAIYGGMAYKDVTATTAKLVYVLPGAQGTFSWAHAPGNSADPDPVFDNTLSADNTFKVISGGV
jgi:hypothetical protein